MNRHKLIKLATAHKIVINYFLFLIFGSYDLIYKDLNNNFLLLWSKRIGIYSIMKDSKYVADCPVSLPCDKKNLILATSLFQAKQINNFERTWRDRNKCAEHFSNAQLVRELLSFDFWISRHFVTTFRNIRTFQDAISLKSIELCQNFFHINLFLSHNVLSKLFIFVATSWDFNFTVNLVTSFSRQKPLKSKKNHRIFWNTEFYHPTKFELKRIKDAKVVPSLQLFACVLAQREEKTHAIK